MTHLTYHQPPADMRGTAPALRLVKADGQPIGYVNRVHNGYAVRDLDGRLIETIPVDDRGLAARSLLNHTEENPA